MLPSIFWNHFPSFSQYEVTEIACASIKLSTLCWKSNLASFAARSGIPGFDMVHIHFTKFILRNKFWDQLAELRLMNFKFSSWLFSINYRVNHFSFLRRAIRRFLTFSPSEPSINEQPGCNFESSWLCSFDLDLTFF